MLILEPTFGLASGEGPGGSVVWGTPKLASTTAYNGAFIPVLKADSTGRLLLAYNQDTRSGDDLLENPYYRQSIDGGGTWSQPAAIHQSGIALKQVTVEFDQQNLAHAVWRSENENNKIFEIWHSREDQWPNSASLITSTVQRVFNHDLDIGPDGTLHVVWAQEDNRIYYAQSKDDGNSWSSGKALSNGSNKSDLPAIAADQSGNVHVVWDERIYYDCPPLPCSTRYEIQYTVGISASQAISWGISSTIVPTDLLKPRQPDIYTQGDQVHVAFARRVGVEPNVDQYAYYTSYTPESDWSEPINVSHNPVTVHSNLPLYLDPALVPCDDALYIYFHGAPTSSGNEIAIGASDADGWTQTYVVDVDNARSIRPSAVCIGGKMHLVYERIIFPNSDHQVYYLSGNRYVAYLPLLFK